MRISYEVNKVDVIGRIWMPNAVCAQSYTLSPWDLANVECYSTEPGDDGITREGVQAWLDRHAGDFSEIIDFRADFYSGEDAFVSDWADEESELVFNDAMFPEYEDA